MNRDQQIVLGITVTSSGQATVAPSLSDILFDLAIKLEESTDLPVDVEHVLAAIVLASRNGQLKPEAQLSSDDQTLIAILATQVKTIFTDYGGQVGSDD
ncbi:hypothetical protein LOC67_16540 [Stieleria sp. JC731]|uniref:hypothetical protein n=1 Tax=Pirellulaceae TaxID=2691357 RepID=UPI001E34A30E|nr:hypothetical protein [Stieleria sp. JC731]MCC9602167.1 hypothetical protein [Stieleria sp. JC731]